MTKAAPSYYEHNAGQAQTHVPEASKDNVDFEDVTFEVAAIQLEDLTPEQRAAYERAFK